MINLNTFSIDLQSSPSKMLLFIVTLKKMYLDDFLSKGRVRFAKPLQWCKPDGTSRGDIFEGVYASMQSYDEECHRFLKSARTNVDTFCDDGITYFRSKDMVGEIRAYCMYGILDTSLKLRTERSQDHKFHHGGIVPLNYFCELFPDWDRERYNECDDNEKPVVLIIQPDKFYFLLKNRLLEYGFLEEEITLMPISYHDYKGHSFFIPNPGEELFHKHVAYSKQSEVRLLIDCRRPQVKAIMDNNDGIIELGPIGKDIVKVSDFYFDDIQLEIRGHQIIYSLATPVSEKVGIRDAFGIFCQILSDEMPESPMSIDVYRAKIEKWVNYMCKSYRLSYNKETLTFTRGKWTASVKETAMQMLKSHYRTYIADGDWKGAKNTELKYKYLFPTESIC